jgi:hypothetical protein
LFYNHNQLIAFTKELGNLGFISSLSADLDRVKTRYYTPEQVAKGCYNILPGDFKN